MALLGAHVSVAGGLELAFGRGEALGCRAIQIFVKNPNQWKHPPLDEERVRAFRRAREESSVEAVVAHAAYLINLGARDRSTLGKSRRALVDELSRCNRLGVDGLIFHPGAHMGRGEQAGLERIADSVNRVLEAYVEREGRQGREARARLLLENTAGQGTVLGYRFAQLGEIVRRLEARPLVGLCLDTCHAFAGGYALDRPRGLGTTLSEIEAELGPGEPSCIHVNDSIHPLGSRRDRHANVGKGEIGSAFFGRLVRHRRLRRTPMVLETPLGDDGGGHRRDLRRLKAALDR
jgi:deoxyribonuclease-4